MARFDSQDAHAAVPNPNAYSRIEFPCMLYNHINGKNVIVNNKQHKDEMLKKGWQLQPKVVHENEDPDPVDMVEKVKK